MIQKYTQDTKKTSRKNKIYINKIPTTPEIDTEGDLQRQARDDAESPPGLVTKRPLYTKARGSLQTLSGLCQ